MTISTRLFVHVPLYIEAVQVTVDNMEDVAEWCEGKVCVAESETFKNPYIKVKVVRPASHRQSIAFERDWVIRTKVGFKVYTPKAFANSFHPVKTTE